MATLELCTCGLHGHIRINSERRGRELCCQASFLDELLDLMEAGLITPDDLRAVSAEISKSGLPEVVSSEITCRQLDGRSSPADYLEFKYPLNSKTKKIPKRELH